MEPKYQYQISEPNEDYRKAVIRKTGMSSAEFTLEHLQEKKLQWSQEKRQLQGQIEIEQSKVDNIKHHHPWVTSLTEEKQYQVWMYYEAMRGLMELIKQRDMRVSALAEYQHEEEEIMKVLGFEKTEMSFENEPKDAV